MLEIKLGAVEGSFANLIWEHEPLTTRQLVDLCQQHLNWKRTTTYTVLKKLCDRGIFTVQDSVITSLISKSRFHTIQSEQFVREHFEGSLPAFLAAFTAGSTPSKKELEEIKRLIDSMEA